jgi:hypothetical protein
MLERRGVPFIAPKRIKPLGWQKPEHVWAEGRTCPANLSGSQLGDRICLVRDLVAEELG